MTTLEVRLAETEVERNRLSKLLNEWIAAAQSGDRFGRLLQEPTPKRLREAIAQAVAREDQQLTLQMRAQAWRRATAKCRGILYELSALSDAALREVEVDRQEILRILHETKGGGGSEFSDFPVGETI